MLRTRSWPVSFQPQTRMCPLVFTGLIPLSFLLRCSMMKVANVAVKPPRTPMPKTIRTAPTTFPGAVTG